MDTKRSDSIANLAAALSVAQGQIKTAINDAKANTGTFTYSYATLDAIWETCRKPLSDNGLSVVQIPTNDQSGFYLETIIAHSSGEWISGIMTLPVSSGRMSELQAMGSAITYARRYMLGAMVGVATGDDDDGQQAARLPAQAQKPVVAEPEEVREVIDLGAVFDKLNRVKGLYGFYKTPRSILACRAKGAELPAPDDLQGWRQLFKDARDYALSEIARTVEEGAETTAEVISDELEAEYPEIFGEQE